LLSQGQGVVRVGAALAWLQAHAPAAPACGFAVRVGTAQRGVYLRQVEDSGAASTHEVTVTPQWHDDTPPEAKTALDLHLAVASDQPWCRAPALLHMASGGRGFSVVVDPTSLPPGLHCATVTGTLAGDGAAAGALFRVPVTVVKPCMPAKPTVTEQLTCGLGSVHRFFYAPPAGATWVDVTLKDERAAGDGCADGSARLMALHLVQLVPNTPFRDQEAKAFVRLLPGAAKTLSLCLEPGFTVEVCAAQYWSTPGVGARYALTVDFRGVEVSPAALCLVGGCGHAPLRFRALLRREDVAPSATLTHRRRALAPTKTAITPLPPDRGVLPSGKQLLKQELEWAYTPDAGGEVATFLLPHLQGLLYDAAFDAQLVVVEDPRGKLLGASDAWPGAIKLGKGKHRVRCQVHHRLRICVPGPAAKFS
jgi:tripeptidyl-peptidase-2